MKTKRFRIRKNDTISVSFVSDFVSNGTIQCSGFTRISDVLDLLKRRLPYIPDHYVVTITNLSDETCKIIEK